YRDFLVEKNAFVNLATSGESQKSTHKYRTVPTQMQVNRKISSSLFVQDVLLHSTDELTLQGWMLHDKSLYRVSTTKKGWRASREDCQKRKADLVVINSREELAFVSRLMDTSWIGLSDREKEGTHKLCSDGWSEEPCNRLHHWICEKVLDLDHLEAERNKEGP
uniref:C-type lectin domain-containing protein n=1 Tax=Gadus morhua TaxID=8049 RepID=A0A8C5B2K7_GADMO